MRKFEISNPFEQNKFELVYDSLVELKFNLPTSEEDIKNDIGEAELEMEMEM